ncbi:MAG: WD40 repeat domain-containing protein [Bacteroidetes bacterium]|nr:MAG: WD40 repeat domain-containing protein [Bacteroidota bacterium]
MRLKVEQVADMAGLEGSVYTLESAQSPYTILSGSSDQLVVEWNLQTLTPEKAVASLPSRAYALRYLDEHGLLLVGSLTGGLHVVDLAQKKELRLLQLHTKTIFDLQYDPKRQSLYCLSADGSFSVWQVPTFELLYHKQLTPLKLRTLAFRPGTNEAAIGCGDGTIRIINTETWEELARLEGHEQDHSVNALAYAPSGKYLISGGRDARLTYWDLTNGYELMMRIPAHNYAIYSIVFHPTLPLFATGSMDKTIRIWKEGSLRPKTTIDATQGGHTNSVNKLLWIPYNDLLLSTGDDRTIKVWRVIP